MKKYILLFLFLFILTSCSRDSDFSFRYHLRKGNNFFEKNYFQDAKNEYRKSIDASQSLKYIAENNKAIIDYELKDYETAMKNLIRITASFCDDKSTKKEFCDQIFYNLGNVYYRVGEKQSDDKLKKEYWQKAIKNYQKDLEINQNDIQAQENIDFILKLLDENINKQKQDNSNSDNKDNASGDKEKKDFNQENNKNNESEEEPENITENKKNIDESTNQKIEKYLKQMEETEKENQKYFQQNPNKQNNSNPLSDFFNNDPFFEEFFNNIEGDFQNNKNSNDKDW